MPIEIKELHIRVNVNDENSEPKSKDKQQQPASSESTSRMIEDCTEKVMDALKRQQLR